MRRRVARKESALPQDASNTSDAETQTIRRLVKRLKWESPIRRIVEVVQQRGPQPIDDVEPILAALCLGSVKPRKKQQAAFCTCVARST
jgi:hypothetical protein